MASTIFSTKPYIDWLIVHDSGADVAPVLFTWPSRGSIFEYGYDRERANFSRDALEETLRRIASDPGVGEITVMAHSMGAWLVMETLCQMAIRDGRVTAKVQKVILASPDLDIDVFATQRRGVGQPHPQVVQLIGERLIDGQTIQGSDVSLRERVGGFAMGLGQTVSGAAGVAPSAPIAILDPNTRRTYDEQVEHLGHVVDETVESARDR
jgi:esterase/lipase superfamily enzyme